MKGAMSLIAGLAALSTAAAFRPDVVPLPTQSTVGNTTITLASSFAFQCASASCGDVLTDAFTRYQSLIFFAGAPAVQDVQGGSIVSSCSVSVDNSDAPLELGVDETYKLTVSESGDCAISAPTQWGALRGVETFAQLTRWEQYPASAYSVAQLPVDIDDSPRFPWRGMLMDTARHYLPISVIEKILDAMSYNKMNTLHWHVVDDESWPLVSTNYPKLSEVGAFAPWAVYNHSDVKHIHDYAFSRGIRVIMEFDVPAHATAFGLGYPELTISCPGGQTLVDPTGPFYPVLTQLLDEFAPYMSKNFIHFGGDEVETLKCWQESQKVQDFMKKQGYTDVTQVRNYFELKVQAIAASRNMDPIFWEEVYDKGYTLHNTSIVDVWLSNAKTAEVVKSGLRAIHSYGWYLDQQQPGPSTHYFWLDTIKDFFNQEPTAGQDLTPEEEARILGGEQSQWAEQVDASSVLVRMWPRASGGAERFWSPKDNTDVDDFFIRAAHQRCRLVRRGINASPLRPNPDLPYGFCDLPPTSPFRDA